jgi:hypothetical protein
MRKAAILFGLVAGLAVAVPASAQQAVVKTKTKTTHTTTVTPKVPTVTVTTRTTTVHRKKRPHRRHVAKKTTAKVTTSTYKHTEKKVTPQY